MIEIVGLENLEKITFEESVKRGLVALGKPVIAKSNSDNISQIYQGGTVYYDPLDIRDIRKDVVAYTCGEPTFLLGSHKQYHACVPIQFFMRPKTA